MTVTPVTPDAVEAAARALYELAPWIVNGYDGTTFTWDQIGADNRADYLDQATVALAAAAPLIAQQALFDAAEAWNDPATPTNLWLTARAATLTPKDKS